MKKFLTTMMAVILFTLDILAQSNAPIQRKFMGMNFNSSISRSVISNALIDYYSIDNYKDGNTTVFKVDNRSVIFGGIKWGHILFREINGCFAEIEFQLYTNINLYKDLLQNLTKKYGTPISSKNVSKWSDANTELYLRHSYEKDGSEGMGFVILNYIDKKLSKEKITGYDEL